MENEDHLKGLTGEQKNFIKSFAKLAADIILKDAHKKKALMNVTSNDMVDNSKK